MAARVHGVFPLPMGIGYREFFEREGSPDVSEPATRLFLVVSFFRCRRAGPGGVSARLATILDLNRVVVAREISYKSMLVYLSSEDCFVCKITRGVRTDGVGFYEG